jgi:hypothetical protein
MYRIGDKFLNKATKRYGVIKGIRQNTRYAMSPCGNYTLFDKVVTEYQLVGCTTNLHLWLTEDEIQKFINLERTEPIEPIKELSNTYKFI